MEELDNPDREIDSRKNDGMVTTWYLTPEGDHYITVEDDRFETFDTIYPPSPAEAQHYFQHPQKYIGEMALPANVILGED